MSDIRFNNWKHQSGTGGVTQNAAGNVGIGSTLPASALDIGGDTHITGVTTASNFKTGSSNLHSAGVEVAGVNVLGADTPIGTGATIYDDGGARFSGIVSATSFSGSIDISSDTSPQLGGNLDVNTKNITFGDSGSASDDRLTFGAGTDMSLFHDGSNSFILNSTGTFYIKTKSNQEGAKFIPDGAVEINHSGTKKLETTSTGAKITGNLSFHSAGQGIDFSTSAHASGMQSELLDDYERGSWTPQFYNARTGGTQLTNPSNTQANYVKVGRIVYLHLGVHGLTKNWAGSGTQIFIRGIPYRSYFQHNGHCVRVGYFGGGSMGNDDMNVYANLRQYDTYMELQKSGGAQGRYEGLLWEDIHWEGYGNLTCEMVYETDQGV